MRPFDHEKPKTAESRASSSPENLTMNHETLDNQSLPARDGSVCPHQHHQLMETKAKCFVALRVHACVLTGSVPALVV
jgi:hypothetical protein